MLRKIYIDRILKNQIFSRNLITNVDSKFLKSLESKDVSLSKSKRMFSYDKKIKNDLFNKKSFLCKHLIGRRIYVHTGKEFVSLKITPSMLGFKVGEFFYNVKSKRTKRLK
jgi:ribosomal protein S19